MNRYVETGLIRDAKAGKAVAVVGQNSTDLRSLFLSISSEPNLATVVAAHGAERVTFEGGGSIRLIPRGCACLRGHRLDVIYVENFDQLTDTEYHEMFASVQTAEMIRP